jgi:hypothetical protein
MLIEISLSSHLLIFLHMESMRNYRNSVITRVEPCAPELELESRRTQLMDDCQA